MYMKTKTIAVCTPQIPFVYGGGESLVNALVSQLRRKGYQTELIQIPFAFYPKRHLVLNALCWRMIPLATFAGNGIDVVIATRFPSYVINHPNKIVWLVHQHRGAYDLFGSEHSDFRDDEEGRYYAQLIRRIDDLTLREARKIFTISENVSNRLKRYNNIDGECLHIPLISELDIHHTRYGDYVVYVSRLTRVKRADLFIRSMAYAPEPLKGVIVGEGPELDDLILLAKELGLHHRIEFKGYVSPDRLSELYADALAVFFPPLDEDYGLVTVEAFTARKPVISCVDSGGPLEFVKDGESGFVCNVDPRELGERMWTLCEDRALCKRLGEQGYDRVKEITWDRTISELEAWF